ncbi:DUF4097 domain-containing protein [Balneolaceae bacterium YR4-1]|uniref:DUF4097 domain-containing protein n=1 Tax=Halalkalibaculum roseum TaxID=2709311 RepID=A0A6M1TC99_9BACT|nr:DUF4097 family beta strand repeat-containing protein [Halalkalibaculum roseum]NGP77743.1 DUF4097 domain-containing protein [Halalkalibaculum roseum]
MSTRDRYKMKVLLIFVLSFASMILLVSTASANTTVKDEPYRVEEFTVSTPGNLNVRTSGGHITVKASESNRVRVEMYVRKNGRDLSASDYDLDDFEIDISQSGNTVRAIAKRENGNNWKFWNNNNVSISFVVYTPREMSSDLKTSGGHIETDGLKGNQEIATSGGHLQLMNLMGTVDARTSGGHIEISDFEGEMNARTSGGHINVLNTNGSINLRTSGGHIDLERISGTVEASTSGGSINADIASIGQFIDLRTSGGNVNISVPDGLGMDLELRGNRVRTELKNFSGKVERDEVEGSINGGGPKISARTSGGTVRISFI